MSVDLVQAVWAQAAFAGLLVVGGSLVIVQQWHLIQRLLTESREDRREFMAALKESTDAIRGMKSEVEMLSKTVVGIIHRDPVTRSHHRDG